MKKILILILILALGPLAGAQQGQTFTWSSTKCSDGTAIPWPGCQSHVVPSGSYYSEAVPGLFAEEIDGRTANVAVTVTKINTDFIIHVGFQAALPEGSFTMRPQDAVWIESDSSIHTTIGATMHPDPEIQARKDADVMKQRFRDKASITVTGPQWTFGYLFFPYDNRASRITIVVQAGNETFRFPFAKNPNANEWLDPHKVPVASPVASASAPTPAPGSVAAQSVPPRKDIPEIAKAANGAVVSIVMSDKDGNPIAQGSGFLVSRDGLIVTNYHVIAQGTSAVIKLPDGAFFVVDGVLAFDKDRDLAVIKAHGEDFRTVTLGNSDRVEVGQEVVAIGNPLSLESTVSNGIVSGIRTVEGEGGKFLQVTTPISPGSSGGPLFNMAGEVIGITTMYLKGGENLNFAIPINDAKRLLLAKSSKIQPLPEEPGQVNGETPDVQSSSVTLSGRDYYKQWYAAGGSDEVPPNSYVCFPDYSKDWADVFFVFKAYALENNDVQAAEKALKEPYIEFVPSNIASLVMSPAAQEVLHQGGRIMSVQTYSKGVQTGDVTYYWDKNIQRWETRDRFQTGPDFTSTIQLVIEPKTLRYVRFMHATSSTKGEDTDILQMDSGACEAIPAKR